jgi:peptide deformylase
MFAVDVTPVVKSSKGEEKIPEGLAMPAVFINPRIIAASGEMSEKEGCLSFPEIFISVRRHREITVEFVDLDGKARCITAEGILSRAIQHELDHLNGKLLVDYMSTIQKVAYRSDLKRLKESAEG